MRSIRFGKGTRGARPSAPLAAAALAALLSTAAASAQASPSGASALDTLVAAERAFSALSVEHGMKEAFLANLAPDAVVFHPAPTNGAHVWRARANPAATLIWAPDFAEISGAGDLGVTSGPWEWRPPAGQGAPIVYGHFNSVWRREKDGTWRVAADIGVQHERPATDLDAVELVPGPVHEKPRPLPREFGSTVFGGALFSGGTGMGFATGPGYVPREQRMMARAINDMMTAERSLVYVTRNQGVERAYPEHAAADVRVFRNGSLPMVGVTEALGALAGRARRVEIAPWGDGMSSSRDLGYSYGLRITRANAAAAPDTASYMHVWRRDGAGRWKLMLDVENEFGKK